MMVSLKDCVPYEEASEAWSLVVSPAVAGGTGRLVTG
jgi:hypothetical protein